MYSMVLMMALTTGGDTPDIGNRGGGCCGCSGYTAGCYGGCGGGCRGGRAMRSHGCHGCYGGGCYGGGCYGGGCYGGGCYGSVSYGGCYGGGCYGGVSYGGCYGGAVISGGCYGGVPVMPGTHQAPTPEKIKTAPEPKKTELNVPAPATLVVELPAEAKLLIDNQPTTSTGDSRVFVSPVLNPGKEYHYTLKAEIVRDGKPVQVEQVIAVRAGDTTPVSLTLPPVGVAQH